MVGTSPARRLFWSSRCPSWCWTHSPPKESRDFDGVTYVLERAIVTGYALVHAELGDTEGNLVFAKSAQNFTPLAAMAGRITIAQVETLVGPGELDPARVHLPGDLRPASGAHRAAGKAHRKAHREHQGAARESMNTTMPRTAGWSRPQMAARAARMLAAVRKRQATRTHSRPRRDRKI